MFAMKYVICLYAFGPGQTNCTIPISLTDYKYISIRNMVGGRTSVFILISCCYSIVMNIS